MWRRWDPHLHAPGTILNDQYGGAFPWNDFADAVEGSLPAIEALGITDYYVTDVYEEVLRVQSQGRMSSVKLIFPNVEMRLSIGTKAGSGINIHLLVDPSEHNHLDELKRFMSRLHFEAQDDKFDCTKAELIRLGYKHYPDAASEAIALQHGVTQFKVDFNQLRAEYSKSAWARENVLVAIAAGSGDGTAGIQENAFEATRRELENFAHIIFASQANQRLFWTGRGVLGPKVIRSRYGALKPCLHGSDAHTSVKVGRPDNDRYSWIKGNVTFDALRQACIEPEGRAFVGSEPPLGATPSQTLDRIEVTNAEWLEECVIEFNPGLVAIVGARGSGKTALADMVAAASHAFDEPANERSFLQRARPLLGTATVRAEWTSGEQASTRLTEYVNQSGWDYPKVQYLSQQFVDRLCLAEGLSDELLAEINRVIFQAHPRSDRGEATSFDELLTLRSQRFREARRRQEDALAGASSDLATAREKGGRIPTLERQVADKTTLIAQYTQDRTRIVGKGQEDRAKRLEEITAAAERIRRAIRTQEAREQALLVLKDEVDHTRSNDAPQWLRDTEQRYPAVAFDEVTWQQFLLDYKGDVDAAVDAGHRQSKAAISRLQSGEPTIESSAPTPSKPEESFLADGESLSSVSLTRLDKEIARLQLLVGADKEMSQRYSSLTSKILVEQSSLAKLNESLRDAREAKASIPEVIARRAQLYEEVFKTVVSEEHVLTSLYRPLEDKLRSSSGTLGKLSFSVERVADVDTWASKGEQLLDLRKALPFRGRGSLKAAATTSLLPFWQKGSPSDVAQAMTKFRHENDAKFLEHAPVRTSTSDEEYRRWNKDLAQWLYSTDHIYLRYKVEYNGVEIETLSPGTRGIVLLLLYLGLDDEDDRPLIIDQPEENLDPKSIFDELVPLFRLAKLRRQVIMVTHNANLVVNSDADQIIVAHCGPHVPGRLPSITYEAGGLEDASIRDHVVGILEGGEEAFKERARRLRVEL
jgi:energy-coupling factor transporter ATP-binding protein EcfA2